RGGHGTSLAPGVQFGIVFLNGPDRDLGRCRTHGDIGGTGRNAYAADYVDLVTNSGGHGRTPPGWHRRQGLPGISGRVVLPRIVDRNPRCRTCRRVHESAERVNLP